jgi:hypothetical protein
MPFPHLFISILWFVSSFVSIYPYVLGFRNTEEMKQDFSFIWIFSIICAVSCAGTIGSFYFYDPNSIENVLDLENGYHIASILANLSFATMILKKGSQTQIAVIETYRAIRVLPFMFIKWTMEIIFAVTSFSLNKVSKILSNQKQLMAKK